MHPDKLNSIRSLPPEDRYGYLIRQLAEMEEVWLIADEGQQVSLGDGTGKILLPVWPAEAFAELYLTDDWKNYSITSMDVHDFMDWLDTLEAEGYAIAGFPVPGQQNVIIPAAEMKEHLLYELSQFE